MGQKHRHKLRGISCVRSLMKLISIIFVVVDEESVILGQTSQPLPSPALNVVKVLCYEDATEAAIAAKTLTQYATVVRGHNYPDDNDPAITSHGAIHARMNISISRVLFSMEDMSIMYHVKVIKRHAQNRFERMLLLLGRLLASIAFKQGMV